MNKLITTKSGGMPDHLDNFRWHEDAVKTALKDIVKAIGLGRDALILYGVTVSQNMSNYFVTAGAIFMNGEIFRVPAHQLAKLPLGQSGTYFWDVVTSYDPDGHLQFQNQVWNNVYEIRDVKLNKTSEVLPSGSYTPLSIQRITEVLTSRSDFNALSLDYTDLKETMHFWLRTNGTGYYSAYITEPAQTFSTHQPIVFNRVVGSLKGDTHIRVRVGGVYKITVHKGADLGLRLYLGLFTSWELTEGDNIVVYTHLGGIVVGNTPDVDGVFQQLTTGEVVLSVLFLGVDFSVSGTVSGSNEVQLPDDLGPG